MLLPLLLGGFGCAPDPADTADTAAGSTTFRVALLSDTHVIGPQYACCSENGDLDNASIVRTVERLEEAVDRINAVEPPVELVVITGDVVHDARVFATLEEYEGVETAWSRARDILGRLRAPYHIAWGNHDYDFSCDEPGYDLQLTHDLFERWLGVPAYEQVDLGGWRFLMANSQLGPTFDPDDPRCDGGKGSFGAEQLAWLGDALAEGLPSLVFSHHYLVVTASGEDPGGAEDYRTVLEGAPNLHGVYAGHAHRWLSFDYGAFSQVLLGGTRYDADNFWILEMQRDGSGYVVLDEAKAIEFTTCSDTWVYDGTPAPDPSGPAETGDCAN